MIAFVRGLISKVFSALLGDWTSPAIKEVVIRESKRIGKKVVEAAIFYGIWRKLEQGMEKHYREVAEINKKLNLPDDDFDPRDLESFMAQ